MNKMLKKTLAVFLCIWMLCLSGFAAFAINEKPFETPASIKLSQTSISMYYGDTAQLTASVLPEGSDQSVTWSSSNINLVAVDGNGKLTAAKDTAESPSGKQTATITVKSSSVPSVTATCTVTVDNKPATKTESFIETLTTFFTTMYKTLADPAKQFTTAIIDFFKKLLNTLTSSTTLTPTTPAA